MTDTTTVAPPLPGPDEPVTEAARGHGLPTCQAPASVTGVVSWATGRWMPRCLSDPAAFHMVDDGHDGR